MVPMCRQSHFQGSLRGNGTSGRMAIQPIRSGVPHHLPRLYCGYNKARQTGQQQSYLFIVWCECRGP
jgi:hypothetical protein